MTLDTDTSSPKKGRGYGWLGILGVGLLFFILRWNNYNAPLIRDEGEYAYAAQLLIHGVAPYEHAFIQKPPMVIYSYALASLCLPQYFWAPRLVAMLCAALATTLLGYAAARDFGKCAAWPAMLLMTPLILLPGLDQFTANTEMFMLLPLLGTVAAYVRGRDDPRPERWWLAAGFLAVTALLYKYTALPVLAFVFIFWSVEAGCGPQTLKPRCWLAAGLGALIAAGLELGYFLIHDGGKHLWECTVQFNRYYAMTHNFSPAYLGARLENFWQAWWILFLVPWAALLLPTKRLGFWAGLLVCALLSTNASGYAQYYLVAMPFWAVLAAAGLVALGSRFQNRIPAATCLLTAGVMALVLWPDGPWLRCSPERFVYVKMNGFPFAGSRLTAKRVAELSSPDDFVFVAGSEPQILDYAGRFSPTRFITAYAMMIPTVAARPYQQEAIQDLQARPPKLVVFTTVLNSWLRQADTPADFPDYLSRLLHQDYDLVGGHLPSNGEGRWEEPLATNDMGQADLLLYQRRSGK